MSWCPRPRRRPLFIAGSQVNLRSAASLTATVASQVPIATECTVEQKVPSGWWRLACGDLHGWAAAEFLSEQRPTVETLLAGAEDPKRSLKDQLDIALRAVTLDPAHPGARARFWKLFVEQELVEVESLLAKGNAPRPTLHVSLSCQDEGDSAEGCLEDALDNRGWGSISSPYHRAWRRFEARSREREGRHMFVSAALEDEQPGANPPTPQQLLVRVGTFEGAQEVDVQVFTVSRYALSDTLKAALAPRSQREHEGKRSTLSALKGKLSQEELGLLSPLSGVWTRVTPSGKEFVIKEPCGVVNPEIKLQLDQDHGSAHVGVDIGNGGGYGFEVMGVQSARNGSVSLRDWDGHFLTYSASRNDELMVNWKASDSKALSGLFVHKEDTERFRVDREEHCFGEP